MASAANCVVYFSSNTNYLTVSELKNHSLPASFVSRPPNNNTLGKRSVRLLSSTTGINPRAAAPSATAVENDGSFPDTDMVPTPKVIIDQDSDPDATVVEITFGDRLGALLDTMNALKSLGLNVTKANVYLDSSGKHNKFCITKASTGRKVEEPEVLNLKEERTTIYYSKYGGVAKADKTEFTECWRTTWKTPYIMKLALSAGIGGLLFGYDTEDFEEVDKKTWLQETIVSMAVAGAIFGAGIGGWMNDRFGRRVSILVADVLFFVGSIVMAVAMAQWMIILGRIFVGFGVGMASMTAPLYISEASPARIRGALVSTNGLLITGGQFLAYLINLAFTHAPGTWRWMLGVAGLPTLVQFILMLTLPESPRWLYRQNKVEEAKAILEKLYPSDEVLEEINALRISVEAEKADEHAIGGSLMQKLKEGERNCCGFGFFAYLSAPAWFV
ncbi:hypothetical protein GOBAR_DD36123 [Gossypium barbadense]|nr:hypothetical protein GOBAR_DD36123 [Gossypium barbadense]